MSKGLHGIAFARNFLEVHPQCELLILEKYSQVGDVWGKGESLLTTTRCFDAHKTYKDRVFDDFWCQSSRRMACFSDVPLDLPPDARFANNNFQAKYVSEYLERYLGSHIYNEKRLRERIRLNAGVIAATRDDSAWTVRTSQSSEYSTSKRLVVATGLSSTPIVPSVLQSHTHRIPVIHQKDFGKHVDSSLGPSSAHQRFTVVGAGESAADLVYAALKHGKTVN